MISIENLLSRLQGVKGGSGQWSARCPAHDDRHNSLSVSVGQDGKILLHCHAGCPVEEIAGALGLEMRELFAKITPAQAFGGDQKPKVVARYDYRDDAGRLIAQKLRRSDKSFTWRQPDGKGGWLYHRKGVPNRLYIQGRPDGGAILLAEGEKDVDTLVQTLRFRAAACGMDGAGHGKWKQEYTTQLRGLQVAILQDNDPVGKAYAQETAAALYGTAAGVKLLDLSQVWPEIPEHGDVSDLAQRFGAEQARSMVEQLIRETRAWQPSADDPFLSCFHTLEDFPEEEAKWLIPGWIPEGQVTTMAADGGTGKTSAWVDIVAGISSGRSCILDPPGHRRTPQRVAFLTTEDSVRKKLRKKLREAGANMKNVIAPDFLADKEGLLKGLKFGSGEMERFIRYFKPALCVFDPIQGFIPPTVNMGSRNEMRDCMASLVTLGEECNTTSLIVAHTNKRKGAFGRDRIADSADLWDISRSVIMMGFTEAQGVRYLSNEKNNYDQLQETLLFVIDERGLLCRAGTTWKRDREYQAEAAQAASKPKREDCKEFMIATLEEAGGSMPSKELEDKLTAAGYTYATFKRARQTLKGEGRLKYFSTGSNKEKAWHTQLTTPEAPAFEELPEDTPVPFALSGPDLEMEQLSVEQS